MEKRKRWQTILILTVIILTFYNILPTVFYYLKPLRNPVGEKEAYEVASQAIRRVNQIEQDSKQWLVSFCKHLSIPPKEVVFDKEKPEVYKIVFKDEADAKTFRRFLPTAGALVPFMPAQLLLDNCKAAPEEVYVARRITFHFEEGDRDKLFKYIPKYEGNQISTAYKKYIYDRVVRLVQGLTETTKQAETLHQIRKDLRDTTREDIAITYAKEMSELSRIFDTEEELLESIYSRYSHRKGDSKEKLILSFYQYLEEIKNRLSDKEKSKSDGDAKLTTQEKETLQALRTALSLIKRNLGTFTKESVFLEKDQILDLLVESEKEVSAKEPLQVVPLGKAHPFIKAIVIDWSNDKLQFQLKNAIEEIRLSDKLSEDIAFKKQKIQHVILDEFSELSNNTKEHVVLEGTDYVINISDMINMQSLLSMNLGYLAEKEKEFVSRKLDTCFDPQSQDLQRKDYPISILSDLNQLSSAEGRLGFFVYSPITSDISLKGFSEDSIYIIARGMENIKQKFKKDKDSDISQDFKNDFNQLRSLLNQMGFINYRGDSFTLDDRFKQDHIFELNEFYIPFMEAMREKFTTKGSYRDAFIAFTDLEQRLKALNTIEDQMQEELVKWRDEFGAAQADMDTSRKWTVPPLTKNVYWENMKLSYAKYIRGDERKTLKWGLDLSGGKTVRIGLRDNNNQPVTRNEDLNQAVNELYTRVNKMGVAERTIRIENKNIILDFPGSQAFSAQELIKGSAMYFHIVNEQFSLFNPESRSAVNKFLQEVWNEAVVTKREEDIEAINEIAWRRLEGIKGEEGVKHISESAKILHEQGLKLAAPDESAATSAFNDTLSKVVMVRELSERDGTSHPLLFVFYNYVLTGANLTNVQIGFGDKGHELNFKIKKSYDRAKDKEGGGKGPQDDVSTWTSQYAADRISGTIKETYSNKHGWRMAVILNDRVITKPNLLVALSDSCSIHGRFTQREVARLAADLKAGSLTFTPRILSEHNVSPDLGKEERDKGIFAALIGLLFVALAMIGYYRFAGVVATVAVFFNLLIMWGILQNLGAALTLPGIAGIVLTIGMAVDANVLVFERIREEFEISNRISSAIQTGYNKAFSAILDSNITTIVAALILIQFDSGPIKGFAVTLIVGLISSMFTALFLTRYYFAGWVRNPKHTSLSLSHWIGDTQINFLKWAKRTCFFAIALIMVGGFYFVKEKNTLFGLDFTGGYTLNAILQEDSTLTSSYRNAATEALVDKGAHIKDFQIQQLNKPNQLRIQLSMGMEEEGHAFHQKPEELKEGKFAYEYEKNPRIAWVVEALKAKNLHIQHSELANLHKEWSMMSGQFSQVMRNNALIALSIALLFILIYITFRFEFKFAIGSVVALAHDVMITLGLLAILHRLGLPVQINLEVIGAIMTIIGYSLNDTIIVFDRIREDIKILRKLQFSEVINHALNVTLSRTLMTSGTTLLVLLSLVFLGGSTVLDFSLVMTLGVIVGTFSSLFIASPVMLYFHNREVMKMSLKNA